MFPAVVCASICVLCNHFSSFYFFSLLPIGIAGLMFSALTCWVSVAFSIVIYAFSLVIFYSSVSFDLLDIVSQAGIFALLPVFFAWIIAPPVKGPAFLRLRTSFRLILGSSILLLIYIPIMYSLFRQDGFYQSFLDDVESVLSLMPFAEIGSDVVEQSLIRKYLTPANILDNIIFFALRGGGLVSILLFFLFSRQVSMMIARLFRRVKPGPGLAFFKINAWFIWLFSVSILAVLLSMQFKFEILEIAAWNVFVVCVMVYAAQGMGIVSFFLNRPGVPRGFRIMLNLFIILMIFRFTVFLFFIAAMAVLGILENWVPLRAPKTNKPPSTPGV